MDFLKNLTIYQQRCFINSLLYQQSLDYNIFLRNIINIPLILISGVLTILNSIMDEKDMKIINIVLNGTVGLILGIMNNFKINDKIAVFKNQKAKMIKLQHKIDSFINSSATIDAKDVEDIVASYDGMIEELEFPIEEFIKKRIKKKYIKFNLPLSLMVVDDCSGELCCIKSVDNVIEPSAIV
jgi:hypothetical protein